MWGHGLYRVPTSPLTVEELRAFLEQMSQLPCVMHQIGEVQVRGVGAVSSGGPRSWGRGLGIQDTQGGTMVPARGVHGGSPQERLFGGCGGLTHGGMDSSRSALGIPRGEEGVGL